MRHFHARRWPLVPQTSLCNQGEFETGTRARLDRNVLRIAPGAPPNKALKLAIEREPDAIYLLTDGDTKVDVAEFL